MTLKTADLYDAHPNDVTVVEPIFRDFGGNADFHGPIATVRCFEDNTLVHAMLKTGGDGRILVVDGGGSKRSALVGDMLVKIGVDNNWKGIVVNGCIRDSEVIKTLPIGVKALWTNPRRSKKKNCCEREVPVCFAGVEFQPGWWLYADLDGIIVCPHQL